MGLYATIAWDLQVCFFFFRDCPHNTHIATTVEQQWSLDDIPAAIRIVPGFGERFRKIREAMMLPPPPPATHLTTTAAATQVLASARTYQNNASAFRLGQTATFSSPSINSPKVTGILKERQHARTAAHQGDHLVAIVASLWKVDGSLKVQQVCLIQRVL